jgi:hypothetical protein
MFVIEYISEKSLYLGKNPKEDGYVLTTLDSKYCLKFPTRRKALKTYRSANYKHRYIKALFNVTEVKDIIAKNNGGVFSDSGKRNKEGLGQGQKHGKAS